MAQPAEITGQVFPDDLHVHELVCSYTVHGQHSQPTLATFGQGCISVCLFSCSLPSAFLADWCLLCAAVIMGGWNGH